MTTSAIALGPAICKAVATAVRENDAPLSAWPHRYPGRWATAARVAEFLGRSTAQVNYHLQELVEVGEVTIAHPWPGGPRGYQPAARWLDERPLVRAAPPDRGPGSVDARRAAAVGGAPRGPRAAPGGLVEGERPGSHVAAGGSSRRPHPTARCKQNVNRQPRSGATCGGANSRNQADQRPGETS
jgi:hypothetical protein